MKKIISIIMLTILAFCLMSCKNQDKTFVSPDTPEDVKTILMEGNEQYLASDANKANISVERRKDTAENGQFPYAVVITCSDSRVPPEHIFSAGIGDLFVIRTAGNVIGDYELGSVEYGAEHLHSKLIVVLGHTGCGAVQATLDDGAHGYIKTITDEIASCLPEDCSAQEAEMLNVQNSIERIEASIVIHELVESGAVEVVGAVYDIATGQVSFLD